MPLATVKALGAGWATAPVVLPQGASRGPLRIAGFDTQCDVKCRHADGSTKLAVLTARVPAAGDYAVAEGATVLPVIPLPSAPNVKVWVSNDTTSWGVSLRDLPLSWDRWLDGLLAVEERHVAPFTLNAAPGGEEFPGLRCILDVRYYRDGGVRVSLCVENCLEGAAPQSYILSVHLDGVDLMEPVGLNHSPYSRYRLVFGLNGLVEAFVLPDWSTAVAAGAVPAYPPKPTDAAARWFFPPLSTGNLTRHMGATGERPELGPVPAWAAKAVGGDAAALAETLAYAENPAGAWHVHVREADGSIPTIDERPSWRFMPYQDPADPHFYPDHEHLFDIASVAYLATGDRTHLEEVVFWGNYALAHTFLQTRGGALGLMTGEETRGWFWGLDAVANAAFLLPDADPLKAYFAGCVENNLEWLENFQRTGPGHFAWGVRWHGTFPEHGRQCVRPWTYDYAAHVVGELHKRGFGRRDRPAGASPNGSAWLTAWLDFRLGWLSDPNYRQWAGAYTLPVDGGNAPGDYSGVWQDPADWPKAHYWPDVMLSVTVAEERGDPRAAQARRWIEQNTRPEPSFASRPHFAVLPRPVPVPDPPEPPPPEPEDPIYPVEAFGVRAGLPGLRWDALAGCYHAGIGERIDLRVDEAGPGYDPAVASATFGPVGTLEPAGNLYPLPSAFVPATAGPYEVRFNTASGQQLVIPVVVEEGRYVDAGPLRTLGTSYAHRTTTDDAAGVIGHEDGERRYYLYSTNAHAGEITTWIGTPDNPCESGGWLAVVEGAPDLPTSLCNGGQAVHDPESGAWLMVTLNQLLLPGGGPYAGYGYEGLAISTDQGRSWRWVGPCSSHPVSYEDFLRDPHAYTTFISGGGSLHHLSDSEGEWLYCYSRCVLGPCAGERGRAAHFVPVTMVRAPARELIALALQGQDCRHLWRGWYKGEWRSPYDGPRDPIAPFGGDRAVVFWIELLQRWGCLFQSPEGWADVCLSTAEARTGPWSAPQRLASVADIPDPWPVAYWGAPMLLEPGGSVGREWSWGIVAYDGRDTEVEGGTGEVRVVAARVTVR